MTPEIINRLKAEVPDLKGRVYGAAALATLMKADAVPQNTPCAHVLPTGMQGHPQPTMTVGCYLQSVDHGFAVVVSLRAHDGHGERIVLDEVHPLLERVALALVGWSPIDSTGLFIFRASRLAAFARGVAIYELTFSLKHEWRIGP
ncbi:phage tail terminator protein [Gemmobacter denitrificans]|uniref:DUF3168 domain-containing protein n=1 Tax=Gemmobacter denitrificans TaxID=3123040 RepID=A0ABU8C1Y0_9RHOB